MVFASILVSMALMLLMIFGLLTLGVREIRKGSNGNRHDPFLKWPPLTMIVPVTGESEYLLSSLKSLLTQDYPCYEVIFSLRDPEDPATDVIRNLVRLHPHASCIFSGNAETCCQKNHNLLAGIRKTDSHSRILTFCDANHLAPSNWLKALIKPIVQEKAVVTTGYHHITFQDCHIPTLGKAFTVLILYLVQMTGRFTQPWGGATAIRKDLFADLNVEQVWSSNVVDDVSLAVRLKKAGIRTVPVPAAALFTPLSKETIGGWHRWFGRQFLFLKFCFPIGWLAAGGILCFLSFQVLFSGILCIKGVLWWVFSVETAWAALFLGLITTAGVALRSIHPSSVPLLQWLCASYAFIFMATGCHLKSWFEGKILWRGITYRVTWKGKITEIKKGAGSPSAHSD